MKNGHFLKKIALNFSDLVRIMIRDDFSRRSQIGVDFNAERNRFVHFLFT